MNNMDMPITNEYLGKSYVWALYDMLPSYGYFKIDVIDSVTEDVKDHLEFSKNTDEKDGKKRLHSLLEQHPDNYRKLESKFDFGFGFDLYVRVST